MEMVNVKTAIPIIKQVVWHVKLINLVVQLHLFVLSVLMDSVLKMEYVLTVQPHQTIVNHAPQCNVLSVILGFIEMTN
jgi:hypothetical protein